MLGCHCCWGDGGSGCSFKVMMVVVEIVAMVVVVLVVGVVSWW